MGMSADHRREYELRLTPGTQEYEEDQAMWRQLNAARSEVLAFVGTAPKNVADSDEFHCAA
jgi:hypothetical protein